MEVRLNYRDTYDVRLVKQKRRTRAQLLRCLEGDPPYSFEEHRGVYCDQLGELVYQLGLNSRSRSLALGEPGGNGLLGRGMGDGRIMKNQLADLEWKLDPDFPGRAWLGGIEELTSLGGIPVHAFALRVCDAGGSQCAWQDEFEHEVQALQEINGGRLKGRSLPELKGEWVACAHSLGA